MGKETNSYDAKPQVRPPFNMDALVQGGPEIEVVPDAEFAAIAADEKFMNEILQVNFIATGNDNDTKLVELGCNTSGHTGPPREGKDGEILPGVARGGGIAIKRGFIRGRIYPIPRYLLEVAAHSKITTMKQVPHPVNPNELLQVEETSFAYPFEVRHDPSGAVGRAWLNRVLSDPA